MPPDDEENDLDGLVLEFSEPLPVHVPEGLHDAIVTDVRYRELSKWKRTCLAFKFRITELGSADGILLPGFVNLGGNENGDARRKAKKPSTACKLARWWRVIADYTGGQRKRVSLAEFKQFLFQVIVTNVKTDNRGQLISDAAQGQVVSEIVAIVSRRGTGQSTTNAQPQSTQDETSDTTQTSGFPPFIPGLGPMKKDSLQRCVECDELTSFSYGCRPFCCMHARQHAEGAK